MFYLEFFFFLLLFPLVLLLNLVVLFIHGKNEHQEGWINHFLITFMSPLNNCNFSTVLFCAKAIVQYYLTTTKLSKLQVFRIRTRTKLTTYIKNLIIKKNTYLSKPNGS